MIPFLSSCTPCTQPVERAKITRQRRINNAEDEFEVGPTCHITNGDEENPDIENFAGQFSKSLPHDDLGRVRLDWIEFDMMDE